MKWILLVMLLNGGVNSAEFDTEKACQSAAIKLNLLAAHHILSTDGYEPYVEAICVTKGDPA